MLVNTEKQELQRWVYSFPEKSRFAGLFLLLFRITQANIPVLLRKFKKFQTLVPGTLIKVHIKNATDKKVVICCSST